MSAADPSRTWWRRLKEGPILLPVAVISIWIALMMGLVALIPSPEPPSPEEVTRNLKWAFLRECTLKASGVIDRPGVYCARNWADMAEALNGK